MDLLEQTWRDLQRQHQAMVPLLNALRDQATLAGAAQNEIARRFWQGKADDVHEKVAQNSWTMQLRG
jgi:hypothetical protein